MMKLRLRLLCAVRHLCVYTQVAKRDTQNANLVRLLTSSWSKHIWRTGWTPLTSAPPFVDTKV